MDVLSADLDIGSSWSKLPPDLLYSVFERLGFADFQRAQYVCSSWHSASRKSQPHNQIPWLILFPKDNNNNNSCTLFNPEEKDKVYKTQDMGVEFAKSVCMATCGSWFFMRDPRYNFYLMNLFTRERIDLPSVESQLGIISIERSKDDMFLVKIYEGQDVGSHTKHIGISLPLFWIDEKTKDYVVFWFLENRYLVYSKKGYKFWKQIDYTFSDMVYKDEKLYLYTTYNVIILDFSQDIPEQIFETHFDYDPFSYKGLEGSICPELGDLWHIKNSHLVFTVTGEILIVKSKIWSDSDVWSFRLLKMNSSHSEWEKVTSLGDEAIFLDLGITVLANAFEGINRNSIYFSGVHFGIHDRVWSKNDIFIYNLDTHMVERSH